MPLNKFTCMFDCLERLSNQDIVISCKYEGKTSVFASHLFVLSHCSPGYVGGYLPNRIYPVIASLSDSETIPQLTIQPPLEKTIKPEFEYLIHPRIKIKTISVIDINNSYINISVGAGLK